MSTGIQGFILKKGGVGGRGEKGGGNRPRGLISVAENNLKVINWIRKIRIRKM